MGNPSTGTVTNSSQTIMGLQTNTVYMHFAKPTGKLNFFQGIIQKVQGKMGFTNWETTHVFASYNNQIIDRTGLYTVTSEQDAKQYLKEHYPGYTIDSYGSTDPILIGNFVALRNYISTTKTQPLFVENQFTGELFAVDTVKFQPNNSVYAYGKETSATFKETFNMLVKKTPVSEIDAIKSALDATTASHFQPSTSLVNPTYCSLTIGGMAPSLAGQQILRYPALTHLFLQQNFKAMGMSNVQTIITSI